MTTQHLSREQLFQNRAFKTVMRPGILDEIITNADIDLFNVSGSVIVTSLFGIARTAIAGGGTPNLQFTEPAVPTTTDMSLAGVLAAQINDVCSWDGDAGGAIVAGAVPGVFLAAESAWAGYIILSAGIISIIEAGGINPNTGTIDWYISYLPLLAATVITAL